MNQIIPAILPKSQSELDQKVSSILAVAKLVQVDVCDGIFVPNKTEFETLPFSDQIDYELDLMIQDPEEDVLQKYIAMKPKRIVLHIESLENPIESIGQVTDAGIEISLAISNDSPNTFLTPFLGKVSCIQFMGIAEIGKQGQSFDPRVLEKISWLKTNHPELELSVDGAVNIETIEKLRNAGVTRFVCGSAVFNGDPKENIEKLRAKSSPL